MNSAIIQSTGVLLRGQAKSRSLRDTILLKKSSSGESKSVGGAEGFSLRGFCAGLHN